MENCVSMNYTDRGRMPYGRCGRSFDSSDKCNQSYNEFPIAMAYVPWQKWRNIYEPCKALQIGTIFEELDKPFLGMRGVKK